MKFKLLFSALLIGMLMTGCSTQSQDNNMKEKPVAGVDGNKYVPYDQRTGDEAIVYFTRNLSAEGLILAYEQVNKMIEGRVGVKLHTGEQNGPNIIPSAWVKALMEKDLKGAHIIEKGSVPVP